MLPLIALAAPLIGGAMSLAGGAMSMTGGVMAAGSTMAGIAADAASGVIGAASRLTGGGKSAPEPEAEARAPADQSTSDEQGAKALPPGVKLNKNGVMIQDSGGPGGGRILPGQFDEEGQLKSMDERLDSVTADRSGASPVNQILDYVKVIAANTARTAMGIGALMQQSAAETAQDNIAGAKNEPPEAKQGMVSKVFGGLTSRMRKLSDGLGGVAKFMLKGLGLAGLIYLFKKNEESITKAVAGVFKFFHNLYKDFKDSDDPMGDLMKKLKEKFDEIAKRVGDMFMQLVDSIKMFVNEKTGIDFFEVKGDRYVDKATSRMKSPNSMISQLKNKYGAQTLEMLDNADVVTGTISPKYLEENNLTEDATTKADMKGGMAAINEMLKVMIQLSAKSNGRIQWSGFPNRDLSQFAGEKDPLMNSRLEETGMATILNSTPVIDGIVYPSWESLDKTSKSYFGGLTAGLDAVVGEGASQFVRQDLSNVLANMSRVANSINSMENVEPGQGITSEAVGLVGGKPVSLEAVYAAIERNEKDGKGFTTLESSAMKALGINPSTLKGLEEQKLQLEVLKNEIEVFEASKKFYNDATTKGSIFTHDTHLEKLLEPVSKAFANGTGSGTVIMDNSSNTNSVTKQGDNIQMPLDVHHSDPTSRAFHQWYHA